MSRWATGRRRCSRPMPVNRDDFVGYAVPALTLGLGLLAWEGLVRYFAIPPYLLPAPSLIIATLITDWPTLSASLWVTLSITLKALLIAVIGSVALAIIFAQSRLVERAFYPFAVAMQVTPIVAIAPLLLIYLTPGVAVLVCAFLVAFFPLLANTTLGLSSADHNLVDLFQMYRASRMQQFMLLQAAVGAALFSRRPAHQRRPGADRRHRRRDRRRVGRPGVGPRVSHCRVRVSPQYSANVRRAALDFGRGHHNSSPADCAVALVVARLARQRARAGNLKPSKIIQPYNLRRLRRLCDRMRRRERANCCADNGRRSQMNIGYLNVERRIGPPRASVLRKLGIANLVNTANSTLRRRMKRWCAARRFRSGSAPTA